MSEQQKRTKVTVGVTGGIAAYKAVELVRALQNAGLDPHVVMTRAAEQFIRPLTFAAITGHKVITSLWGSEESESANLASAIDHIDEAQTTQALVVAPATADTLAKFAHGLADDFLSTLHLATKAPIIVAPTMNVNMWQHPATQANLDILRARGVHVVEPGSGYLACGMVGDGRLADTSAIVEAVFAALAPPDLVGETILITAGGTREPIDPVRFLGNRSSGRMGYALAEAAQRRGASVLLITAAQALAAPAGCEVIAVETAEQMHDAVLERLPEATVVIKAAAVADYRVPKAAPQKIKRSGPVTLELEPTPDIAHEVVERRSAGTLVVVFAAETDSDAALVNGRAKLERKGADAIFVNDVSLPGLGFDAERNTGTWITPDRELNLPPMSKLELAGRLLDEIVQLRRQHS